MQQVAVWTIAGAVVLGMLVRPKGTREWMWAVGGAIAVLALGLLGPSQAWGAVARGADVYAFLIGILAMAAAARHAGLFARVAVLASRAAGGSRARLFALVYGTGMLVTAGLSNDTAAVVLAPAVLAVLQPAGIDPRPYLFACAFVANAASLLFPFSNPANLVVFGNHMPSLGTWLHVFGWAAIAALAVTYALLRWVMRRSLALPNFSSPRVLAPLDSRARIALLAIGGAIVVMVVAASLRWNLGLVTLLAALVAVTAITLTDATTLGATIRRMAWQVVPLVAGLFVVVAALDHVGALARAHAWLAASGTLPWPIGELTATFGVGLSAGLFNNLPVALATGYGGAQLAPHVVGASLAGIDLGPNLCVTGSLSTMLWLIVLRKEGIEITAGHFLRIGWIVALPSLLLAALLV